MNRQVIAVPLLLAATLALGACSSPTPHSTPAASTAPPSAGSTTTSGNGSNPDPLAAVNPCSLLTPGQLTQHNLIADSSGKEIGARFCSWRRPESSTDPTNLQGYVLSVNIYDHNGLNEFNKGTYVVTPYQTLNNYQTELEKDPVSQDCQVSIAITATSRVDIDAIPSNGRMDTACTIAEGAAPVIAQNLPPAA